MKPDLRFSVLPHINDRLREVKHIQAIRTKHLEGAGISIDPVREVTSYYTAAGVLIGRHDPDKEKDDDSESNPVSPNDSGVGG